LNVVGVSRNASSRAVTVGVYEEIAKSDMLDPGEDCSYLKSGGVNLVDEAALVCLELPMDKVWDVLDAEDAVL
jgi:hypothetical protein